MFTELFPAEPGADALLDDIARDFAFAVMSGVALQRLFPHGERPATDYLDALKRVFRLARLTGVARAATGPDRARCRPRRVVDGAPAPCRPLRPSRCARSPRA